MVVSCLLASHSVAVNRARTTCNVMDRSREKQVTEEAECEPFVVMPPNRQGKTAGSPRTDTPMEKLAETRLMASVWGSQWLWEGPAGLPLGFFLVE